MSIHATTEGSQLAALIAENERLCAACEAARVALATAYGCTEPATVAAVEQPSAAWISTREQVERRLGVRLWKYFTRGQGCCKHGYTD